MQLGVSRFEAHCASTAAAGVSFDTISKLYEDPTDLAVIEDVHLRMQARACIQAAEADARLACFHACTAEAQKLAQQFSEGEFISKLVPDSLEKGVIDSIRKIFLPISEILSGAKMQR